MSMTHDQSVQRRALRREMRDAQPQDNGANKRRVLSNLLVLVLALFVLLSIAKDYHGDILRHYEEAKENSCLSNEKQLGLALNLYAQDNDGELFDSDQWMSRLSPYVKVSETLAQKSPRSVFQCPAFTQGKYGYAFNSGMSQKNIHRIEPEKSIAIYESTAGRWNATDAMTTMPSNGRHRGLAIHMINVGFADGHVKAIQAKSINKVIETSQLFSSQISKETK